MFRYREALQLRNGVKPGIDAGKHLIGPAHVGISTMIKQIQKEQNEAELEIEKSIRGEPAPKKRKEDDDR
ncbi:unnamed protein product [Didymodactylos carnosus]|uniref:Uncharacterized protein n=2 Tax=Didymodactylos carnosus TaxID=1234261 RepID=A0A8S2Q0I1_9BILA|nr:unnamed protein product [Didymodactylos carnosus]CAF4078056.1 unnamed protein product [Didymodactylos carnosus]